jgi:hypothetical protein
VTDGFADTLGEGGGRDVAKAKIRVIAEDLTHVDEDMAITTDGVSAESLDQATRLVRRIGTGALGSAGPKRRNSRQWPIGEERCATIKEHDGTDPEFALDPLSACGK